MTTEIPFSELLAHIAALKASGRRAVGLAVKIKTGSYKVASIPLREHQQQLQTTDTTPKK